MSNRNLLHKSKLEDFKNWLDLKGILHRAGKGSFQVLQVMTHKGWQVVFDKHTEEHFTVNEVLMPTVIKFVRESKTTKPKGDVVELLQALKSATYRLDRISQGYDYPREDMIAMVEKARDVIAKFERVGDK